MRVTCQRCRRPDPLCVCKDLPAIPSVSRVVLLQHPREAKVAICSARLTRLALERAELHRGVVFEEDPRVRALAETPGAALLFPGGGATPAQHVPAPPSVLFVFDGTWFHAGKMLTVNPRLAALPRIAVFPSTPSGYGELRREPAPGHLSTAEAVALALGLLERDPEKFAPLVHAFRRSVELQLEVARSSRRAPRHRPPAA
jgi:hypothetical protein